MKENEHQEENQVTLLASTANQERIELRPQFGIQPRSPEHCASLMVSESQLDSEPNGVFSRGSAEPGHAGAGTNGTVRNRVFFGDGSKAR